MSFISGAECVAMGCKDAPTKKSVFCLRHWRLLPEALRGPTAARQARIFLAKKDGYLVDAPPKRGNITEIKGTGREYV